MIKFFDISLHYVGCLYVEHSESLHHIWLFINFGDANYFVWTHFFLSLTLSLNFVSYLCFRSTMKKTFSFTLLTVTKASMGTFKEMCNQFTLNNYTIHH